MVALFVALTFILALLIDALIHRGREAKETVELTSFVKPEPKPSQSVLVVDDENVICKSCQRVLTRAGYNVDLALSGEEALNKVKEKRFDLVIADWKLPEIDGIEVTRRIRRENPNIVVIMITGYPSLENSITALRLGVSDYVVKPFTPEELSDAVTKALEKVQTVPKEMASLNTEPEE